jgi:hypothetical protein
VKLGPDQANYIDIDLQRTRFMTSDTLNTGLKPTHVVHIYFQKYMPHSSLCLLSFTNCNHSFCTGARTFLLRETSRLWIRMWNGCQFNCMRFTVYGQMYGYILTRTIYFVAVQCICKFELRLRRKFVIMYGSSRICLRRDSFSCCSFVELPVHK